MEHLNEDDVVRLIKNNPNESTEVEFKERLSLDTHSNRFELAKDITAMASALGGKILLGVTKKGDIVGIDPSTFDLQRMHDVLNNRAIHYVDFDGLLVDMPGVGPNVKVGVIVVEKSANPPVCIWSPDRTRIMAYRRQGNTIKQLNADEVKKLSQESVPRAPSWHRIDTKQTGVFSYDFCRRESFFEWYMAPEQDRIWAPVLPVPLPFLPLADGMGVRAYCGGVSGGWLEALEEVERQIDRHHGIIAECWTIRNSPLLAPLPEKMQYFTGPSVECLIDALKHEKIHRHSYLSCVFLAYRNLLYVFQGQMNNVVDMSVYSSNIPARPKVIKLVNQKAALSETDFSFINLRAKKGDLWRGISIIGAGHPTREELEAQPNAELLGYIGQRTEGSFKVRGVHIFKISEELRKIIRESGEEGRFLTQADPPFLFSHVSSRMSEEDKVNVKITGLRLTLQAFDSTNSTTLIMTADCGIY